MVTCTCLAQQVMIGTVPCWDSPDPGAHKKARKQYQQQNSKKVLVNGITAKWNSTCVSKRT